MQYIPLVVFIPILIAIGYRDFKSNIIPNKITYPAVVLAISLNFMFSPIPWQYVLVGGFGAFIFGLVLLRMGWLTGGDLKFMLLIGLMFGYPWFVAVFAGAFMLAGMLLLVTHLAKRLEEYQEVPFGPYLAVSGIVICGWLMFLITFPG